MFKLCLSELKKCSDTLLCKLTFWILMVLNMVSYVFCTRNDFGKSYQFIRSANENFVLQATEVAFIPYIMIIFFPITSIFVWGLSTNTEIENQSALLIIQRVGKKKYIMSKIFAVIVSTFLINVVPLLASGEIDHSESGRNDQF